MATTENLAAFLAEWDTAMGVYDTAHGTNGADDMLGAGFNMFSTVAVPTPGLWTLEAGVVPDMTPNSHVPVFWTDGTDVIGPISFDDLSDANKVAALLNGYFGPNFKMWRLLTHVQTAMVAAGATVAAIGAGPWTQADYNAFYVDLESRYAVCTEPQGLELPGIY